MPLTAIRAATGEIVEAFDVTPQRWQEMKSQPPGTYLIRHSGSPAILKKNLQGTFWFAARPSESDPNWKPTSPEHEFPQIQLVKALRNAGFTARIEEPGCTPTGERWEADVFVECAGRKIAIEVQMSQQTLDEYERRSERYLRSGVKVVWLINSRHFENFTLGCLKTNGYVSNVVNGPIVNGEQYHRRFPAFPLRFNCPKGKPTDAAVRAAVFMPPKGWPTKDVSLGEFAVGLAKGALLHSRSRFWVWAL